MLFVIAEFLLRFPFFQVALDNFEALRFFEVNTYGNFLSTHIQFDRLTVTNLLFLLGAQFDVIDLFHILEFLLQFDVRHLAVDDRLGLRVKLQVLLCLFTVYIYGFLYDVTSFEPFRFLLGQEKDFVAPGFQFRPYRISHECGMTVLVGCHLEFEG